MGQMPAHPGTGRYNQAGPLGADHPGVQVGRQAFGPYVPANPQGQHCSLPTVLDATLAFHPGMWRRLLFNSLRFLYERAPFQTGSEVVGNKATILDTCPYFYFPLPSQRQVKLTLSPLGQCLGEEHGPATHG